MKKQRHWLDFAEYASLVGLGVGSVASFVSSQVLYTSAPLSLLVLLNLANRRRFEQLTEQKTTVSITEIDRKLSKNIELLNQQVLSLPTVEAMGSLKKTLLSKNREVLGELTEEIKKIKQDVSERFAVLDRQNLGSVRQEVASVQSQYNQLNEAVAQLNTQLSQLSTSTRLDEVEGAIAKLKTNALSLRDNLKALSDQTRPILTSLQDQINHLNRQFQKLPPPFDATALRQEVTELIRVVADLVPKREWHNLQTEIRALQQQQESRNQSEEALRQKLQEFSLQLQKRPEKSSLTSLQNQIHHLDRQIKKLPPPFDSTSLKREIAQLVKAVGELVPKRDWGPLTAQIKALQQQQEFQKQFETTLRRELDELSQQLKTLSLVSASNHAGSSVQSTTSTDTVATASPVADSKASSEANLETSSAADAPTYATVEQPKALATSEIVRQPQAEFQERIEIVLDRELQALDQQLRALPNGTQLQAEIEATVKRELQDINEQLLAFPANPQYQLVFDFTSAQTPTVETNSSRSALEHALEVTQERLILIMPWSSQTPLDQSLLQKLEAFLQRGRQLDVGWCHQANRDEERLLTVINHRWSINPIQKELQSTLQKLLQLKRHYPQHFQFKVLGTSGNFLVSDQAFAIVGMNEALVATRSLPEMELKLWTDDTEVIQQCITQFDHPVANRNDITAYWNQAVTRYDLSDREGAIADFDQVLSINPNDAIAYNYRGLARYDLGDLAGAIADFNRSLDLNPHQVAPYCNRGFIRSEQGDQLGAISDFSLAIEKQPNSAIAYFYRGIADQKYNDPLAAATDFGEAIRLQPNAPMAYYYRGQAYQKLENLRGAIADFELAARLFTERGNSTNAQKASKSAAKLKRLLSQQSPTTSTNGMLPVSKSPEHQTAQTQEPISPDKDFFYPAGNMQPATPQIEPETNGYKAASNGTNNSVSEPALTWVTQPLTKVEVIDDEDVTEILNPPTVVPPSPQPAVASTPEMTSPVLVSPETMSSGATDAGLEDSGMENAVVESSDSASSDSASPFTASPALESSVPEFPVVESPSAESPGAADAGMEDSGSAGSVTESPTAEVEPLFEAVVEAVPSKTEAIVDLQHEDFDAGVAEDAIADINLNANSDMPLDGQVDRLVNLAEHLDDAQTITDSALYGGIDTLSTFFYDAEPMGESMTNGTTSKNHLEKQSDRPDGETLADFRSRF